MANTYIQSPTMANPPTGASKKGTWSFWMKKCNLGQHRFFGTYENGNNECIFKFKNDDSLQIYQIAGGSNNLDLTTNRKFVDTNAWFHIVIAVDTTLGTAGDRVKLYVNGERETSFATNTNNMPQNHSFHGLYGGVVQYWGRDGGSTSSQFDGLLSYVAFIDGTQELPTIFGEVDSSSGIWKIKTGITPSSAWGTNGYLVLKDGNSVTDQSVNSNNFTVGAGTLTPTKDNPSNNYSTMNVLHNYYEGGTYANAANEFNTGGSGKYTYNNSSFGVTKGKWYCEYKWVSGGTDMLFGITDRFTGGATSELGNDSQQFGYRSNGTVRNSNGNLGSWTGATFTHGDIIGIALDMDNNKVYFSKNGAWQNSGNPESGSTGTGAASISATPRQFHYWFSGCLYDDAAGVFQSNFGNGYFGTSAISSAGSNGNGSLFEYDCPNGYYALNTKNINTYG